MCTGTSSQSKPLTLRNILVADPNDITSVKLIDFGLSFKYNSLCTEYFPNLRCGTLIYMAPEVVNKQPYSKSIDMWSLGITIYKLVSGKHPLHRRGDPYKTFKTRIRMKAPITMGEDFSELCRDFLSKLTQYKGVDRYVADDALQHPWITRDLSHPIPLTTQEQLHKLECEDQLIFGMNTIFFMSAMRMQADTPD